MLHINIDVPKLPLGFSADGVLISAYLATVFVVSVLKFSVLADHRADIFFLKLVGGQIFNIVVASKCRSVFGRIMCDTVEKISCQLINRKRCD